MSSVDSFEQLDATTQTPTAILKDSSAQIDEECHTMDSSGQVHSTDADQSVILTQGTGSPWRHNI